MVATIFADKINVYRSLGSHVDHGYLKKIKLVPISATEIGGVVP